MDVHLLPADSNDADLVASWTPGNDPPVEIRDGKEKDIAIEKKREILRIATSPQPPFVYYDEEEGCVL